MSSHETPRRTRWWRRNPKDIAGIEDAKRRREEADALARRLEVFRRENHFGEKLHLTFAPQENR